MTEYTPHELIALLAEKCDNMGGQKAFADAAGVSETLVSLTLSGDRKPKDKIGQALGLRKKVTWIK